MPNPDDYESALERMGIDPQDYEKVSEYQATLRAELGKLTRSQQEAFSKIFYEQSQKAWKDNVTKKTFTRADVPTIRYFLKGKRGMFNYGSARSFVQRIMEQ